MSLTTDQLARRLEKGVDPLYTLHGDEPLLVLEAADAIRSAARKHGYTERDTFVVGQGFRWNELAMAAGNLSLFGDRKIIDLRIPGGKPGRDGGDALQRYVSRLGDATVTLITLPQIDWQTRKTSWFRALTDAGNMLELNAPQRENLPEWIAQRLARQNQHAPPDALNFIADHVEGNLLAAHQEILKLGLLHSEGELSMADVEQAVLNVARYDIGKLSIAILSGDTARCVRLLEGLEGEGTAAPLVLWALSNEIRTLAKLRVGMDHGQAISQLLRSERVFDERKKQALQTALPRLSSAALRAALQHAARIDRMIKGLTPGHIWDEFQLLALRLVRR